MNDINKEAFNNARMKAAAAVLLELSEATFTMPEDDSEDQALLNSMVILTKALSSVCRALVDKIGEEGTPIADNALVLTQMIAARMGGVDDEALLEQIEESLEVLAPLASDLVEQNLKAVN